MTKWQTIALKEDYISENVYVLELNRPEAMNSLNTLMGTELIDCLKFLRSNEEGRVLVLTGSGEKSFCAGADLKERKGMTNEQWKQQHDIFEEAYEQLRNFPFPVIAAVNGFALGGGMEIVLSCDLRYAADHAKMGLPEVRLGIIPGVGGTQLLPRAIPVGLAKEMLFRGNQVNAQKALDSGVLNGLFSKEELFPQVLEIAKEIARNAPLSLKSIKKSIHMGLQTDLNTAMAIELDQYYKCANSEDRKEGILSFNEKRKPQWQGK
ncbi:enoyl-CoA hydratase/isomerase family protein [Planomicrobium sp. CPCC 101110]|uniref:enoyl-CoA hydratase/isomerase family protein n=1 Tax=Planomicrobium sp. CPCC 101110 TaxID=2599619 RepID=UPI0011B74ED4|nr:enoyl-CoA hydratase-related protein [Planomicrobium sp. CPCC 101110]TWT27464.1 enoyl-CoA hydratase [Planomicrobium sp. CPCC 101110]